jgi:hypothetical protein
MKRRRASAPRRIPKAPRLKASALKRTDVTRAEYNRVIEILNERNEILNGLRHNSDIQFQRIAQLQADVDLNKRALEKLRVLVA